MKYMIRKKINIVIISFFILFFYFDVFALWNKISEFTSRKVGSNSNFITFSKGIGSFYVNKDNDNSIKWDYFKWYYFDDVFWYFKFDWSSENDKNVHFGEYTLKCNWNKWYMLEWYSYNKNFWLIKFDNSSNNPVCYSLNDKMLYWYSYSENIWFQSFKWIKIDIWKEEVIKQKTKNSIYIEWITNIDWYSSDIIYKWYNTNIKYMLKKNIFNISKVINTRLDINTISDFNNIKSSEKYYIFDYNSESEKINFSWKKYVNEWKKLKIENNISWKNNIVGVKWINTVIVNWWNIYIKSDIKNWNDNKDLLILISQRNNISKKWWNIYIDPKVTNIDAILILDGSLISLDNNNILSINNKDQINKLRKQLLIYWRVFSKNSLLSDNIPYWADLYNDKNYSNNIMSWSIYDLWNLRIFEIDDWIKEKKCTKLEKKAPIDWAWDYLIESWAWRKECYIDDAIKYWLRWSDITSSVIIKNNTHINFLKSFILKNK